MIKQIIKIQDYWKVIVYYNIDYNFFSYISNTLKELDCEDITIRRIYDNMYHNDAKAVTISNINLHISVVLFNNHLLKYDYINSIIHECEHIKQSILNAYNIEDKGEPPAYLIGYIGMKLLQPIVNKSLATI